MTPRSTPALVLTWALSMTAWLVGLPARAGEGVWPESVSGVATLALSTSPDERSWVDRGLGKLGTGAQVAAGATLAWRSSLSDRVGALVSLDLQSPLSEPVSLGEAFLTLRPTPGATVRLSGRAGLFFPPASLEHDGSEWSLSHTLTPSVINSWVAEEVKVAGFEITARGHLAGRPVGLTVAGFQGNDTAGTLLFFRGWAQHDLRGSYASSLPLPPRPALFSGQGGLTRPVYEVDDRWGTYVRADLAPAEGLDLNVLAYDNNGDRTGLVRGQYAWRTRFLQLGVRWAPDTRTLVLAQTMSGETSMGRKRQGLNPAEIGFESIFVLVSREMGPLTATARAEHFAVDDHTFKALDNNAEHGWSGTLAVTKPVRDGLELVLEGVYVRSDRPDRQRFGLSRAQDDLRLTTALRASF